ncbi:MAG: flagellar basal body L-ring protein FlgH [Candidatus Kapabacteria bacterium]|nr:flagellar basal body L-ring protein FlgH [Candidatus Kapabacteria bacterium]
MKTLMKYFSFILIFITQYCCLSAQFLQNSNRSIFSDVKAVRKGDAVTILIIEETSADNSSLQNESKDSQLSGGIDLSTGTASTSPSAGLKTGNSYKGSGATSRKENIKSKITAKVDSVDENGNLRITGTRITTINGEKQTIVIRGYVRPADIMSSNMVYSYNIIGMELSITGDGSVSKTTEPGYITRFLRILF